MNDVSWAGLGAAIGSLITGFFAWLVQQRKSGTEIEVAVLAEWQKLNLALSNRVSALEEELAAVRRAHSDEIDQLRRTHRAEMKAMRDLNEGLQRMIAQDSRSTARLLGDFDPKVDGE